MSEVCPPMPPIASGWSARQGFEKGQTRNELAWQHPGLTVEVYSDDALVDTVERGFEAGVRLGEKVQQDNRQCG